MHCERLLQCAVEYRFAGGVDEIGEQNGVAIGERRSTRLVEIDGGSSRRYQHDNDYSRGDFMTLDSVRDVFGAGEMADSLCLYRVLDHCRRRFQFAYSGPRRTTMTRSALEFDLKFEP